ncbi:iron-sulfur cluster assembly scaffold protein [Candidatus Aenigmatarchaeota archaeon]
MVKYEELIIDYYRNPRNKGIIENPDIKEHISNPVCGDSITIYMRIKSDIIEEIKFMGNGCAISMAAISMFCEKAEGLFLKDVEKMTEEDIKKMLNIDLSPSREKCATLGFHIVQKGIFEYNKKP